MSDQEPVQITLPREEWWRIFYALSDIRDCNLLTPEQLAATELINDAIAAQLRAQGEGESVSGWPFTPQETELLFDLACKSREQDFHHDNYVLRSPTPQAQHDWDLLNDVINKLYLQGTEEEEVSHA